jgi:hypothetical protein
VVSAVPLRDVGGVEKTWFFDPTLRVCKGLDVRGTAILDKEG